MMQDDNLYVGILGTAITATGASLSVTDLQAIISIIVTIADYIISVLITLWIKLADKIKDAKEDGKVDKEEMKDILSTGQEILEETKKVIDKIDDKNAGDKQSLSYKEILRWHTFTTTKLTETYNKK